jgi:two-component system response regulator YesN
MMKVLIVDDEKHVRSSIRLLIDWNALHIQTVWEAEDGLEAIEIIERERPQLVITDMMMPLMNGMGLMEWMDAHAPSCKKIVISGHNDFELVRHTVKYGATDYLLKPIVGKQLQDAIQKAVHSWNEADQERVRHHSQSMEVNELKSIYRDKLLSNLMMEPVGYSNELQLLAKEFPELVDVHSCRIALISLHFMQRDIQEKYASNMGLLVFSLINICNDFLREAQIGIAFRNLNSNYEIVLLLWGQLEQAEALIDRILYGIAKTLKAHFDIGIGTDMPFPHQLQEAYKQAKHALSQRNLLDPMTRNHTYRVGAAMRVGTLRFGDYEEMISLAMKSGRPEQLEAAIQKWFDLIVKMDKISMDQLELWWDEYNVLKARWIEEFFEGSEAEHQLPQEQTHFVVPMDDDGRFSLTLFQQVFTHHLIGLMRVLLSKKVQSGHTMNEIAKYIELNYYRNITLQDISSKFHLNREYISRKFKQELQENVIDYLNRVRIEKSKVLLLNPQIKIVDVAGKVGYQDEKYFSRVFKKWEGQTPKDFRVQMNRETTPQNDQGTSK